ncbi:MAG: hypothetical protein WBR10_17290, partial [Candidatus Acidiferrum sp.]
SDVFDSVVLIDVEISFRSDFQIEGAVPREEIEHVVKKANARGDARLSTPVEIQFQPNIGFVCLAVNVRGSWHCGAR